VDPLLGLLNGILRATLGGHMPQHQENNLPSPSLRVLGGDSYYNIYYISYTFLDIHDIHKRF